LVEQHGLAVHAALDLPRDVLVVADVGHLEYELGVLADLQQTGYDSMVIAEDGGCGGLHLGGLALGLVNTSTQPRLPRADLGGGRFGQGHQLITSSGSCSGDPHPDIDLTEPGETVAGFDPRDGRWAQCELGGKILVAQPGEFTQCPELGPETLALGGGSPARGSACHH
jgi:hypothetical protein